MKEVRIANLFSRGLLAASVAAFTARICNDFPQSFSLTNLSQNSNLNCFPGQRLGQIPHWRIVDIVDNENNVTKWVSIGARMTGEIPVVPASTFAVEEVGEEKFLKDLMARRHQAGVEYCIDSDFMKVSHPIYSPVWLLTRNRN